ncbi:MAG: hypothetical protein SWH68_03160 [Thermodesulfobacteriota bacterium]|nr:hypothetical protein [Thermodesulfobacteriota bacterium]
MHNRDFVIYAGKKALSVIRDGGFSPDRVAAVAGAAGGPKWLVLYGLDRFLFGDWFKDRERPLYLLGASIGTWRFAGASVADPLAAIDRLKSAYIYQRYSDKPTAAEVSAEAVNILKRYIGDDEIRQILEHPYFRLNFLAVRCTLPPLKSEARPLQLPILGLAALCNTVSRSSLGFFFQRALFHHPVDGDFFNSLNGFPLHKIPLTPSNIRKAMIASGSIPMVMQGVADIPDAPPGVYRDGGIIDYHLNVPFATGPEELVLFPHYVNRIIPGWFDKQVKWRKPDPGCLDNVVMVAPSPAFVASLPHGKIPDRKDFITLRGRDDTRFAYWNAVADKSRALADSFHSAVASGRVAEMAEPFV